MLVSACSSPQIKYVTKTEYQTVTVPDNLYPHCDQVEAKGTTYGDAIELVGDLRAEIVKCNVKSDTLKSYIDTMNKTIGEK